MFKRVDKATGKRDKLDQLKKKTGDDTAVSIDQLADESSSSGSDSDSESSSSSSDGKENQARTSQNIKRKRSRDNESDTGSDAGSSSDQDDEDVPESARARPAHEGPAVTIDDALKDPVYVPTSGHKKHGVMASKCILCEKVSLKSAHLVEEHLKGKNHKRRMERFTRYIKEQLSDIERRATDARDAVEDMDAWSEAQLEQERKAALALRHQKQAASGKPSRTATRKEKMRETRREKKNAKRQAKKLKSNAAVEDPAEKKERKKRKYGDKKQTNKV